MTEDVQPRTDGGETITESDIFMTPEEGSEYFDSVYRPVDYEELEDAPETNDYPDTEARYGMTDVGGFKLSDLPKVPRIRNIVGPSAIMLGAALGSGETLFWPTLVAQNGWALYWAFWVGVLTQFFINTEIQRWTLATGEGIFRGYERLHLLWPWFFLVAGFFHVGWPGWAAGSGKVLAAWFGMGTENWVPIGIGLMILIWLTYQVHPIVYLAVEKAQTALMAIAIAFAIILLFVAGDSLGQLVNLPGGAVSFGTLPEGMDIAVFLGGLAYAGTGGYGNLTQSLWSREKGYAMGTYQGRVKNPLIGEEPEVVHENGITFEPNEINMRRWKNWWKVTQTEHFLTFVLGLLIVATAMIAVARNFAAGTDAGALDMWLGEIIPGIGGIAGFFTYGVLALALFSTQYAIMELFVRNSVDILYEGYGRAKGWDLNRVFWSLITIFVLWGILIIALQLEQPWILLVIGAAIAGVMMWPYNALTLILNLKLPEHAQPGWARVVAMWWAVGFFGYFSILLIADQLVSRFGLTMFETSPAVVGSSAGAYVLWVFALVVQVYVMYLSAKMKMNSSGTVDGAETAKGFLS